MSWSRSPSNKASTVDAVAPHAGPPRRHLTLSREIGPFLAETIGINSVQLASRGGGGETGSVIIG